MELSSLIAIAHGWLSAFENNVELEELLRGIGCTAFDTFQAFTAEFSDSEMDINLHRKCYIEYSKLKATMAPVLNFHPAETRTTYYKSSLLENLRVDLASRRGFGSVDDMMTSYKMTPWEGEPDPLLRKKMRKMRSAGQDGFMHFQSSFRERALSALNDEADCYPDSPYEMFNGANRADQFAFESLIYLECFGFGKVKTKGAGYGAVDLKISDLTVLRWSIGEHDNFFYINNPAIFRPSLHLRETSFKNTIREARHDTMLLQFNIDDIVEGMRESYLCCRNVRDMKAAVRAYTAAIIWVLPTITEAIRSNLYK